MTHLRTLLVGTALAVLLTAGSANAQQTLNCDGQPTERITAAIVEAGLMLRTTDTYLAELQSGVNADRFDYWFGDHSELYLNRVTNTLHKVYQVMDDTTFNCECPPDVPEGTVARVLGADPDFHVRLCPLFFTVGIDEAIATVVHELSHFFYTVDCMDPLGICNDDSPVPSGPAEAHSFAQREPYAASNNAYSLEYFVTDWDRM
jgi:hypothetical protein